MLLRSSCAACRTPGPPLCLPCRRALVPAPVAEPPVGLEACWSLLAYDGVGRDLIVGLKYRNARSILGRLGAALAALIGDEGRALVDLVTWAPTSPARRRDRGYDQAQLLAHAVARSLALPCRPLLDRHAGPAQTGRSRIERLEGPAFRGRSGGSSRVLIIDDVLTTGATLRAAAHALRASGCSSTCAATAARTPGGHEPPPPPVSEQNVVHLVVNAQGDGPNGRKRELIVGG
jgi:predicted amidophosphoribosyltransferase